MKRGEEQERYRRGLGRESDDENGGGKEAREGFQGKIRDRGRVANVPVIG